MLAKRTRVVVAVPIVGLVLGIFASIAQAQEMGLLQRVAELEARLTRIEGLLRLSLRPMAVAAPNLRNFIEGVAKRDLIKNEYFILRNNAFVKIQPSVWNEGWMISTEPYFTGDYLVGAAAIGFRVGGSMWIYNTKDTSDDECNNKSGALRHYYYFDSNQGFNAEAGIGNGCMVEGPVYSRPRIFIEDVEAVEDNAAKK